ncbi:putative polarized growth protein [Truncatella angustata]|uniref:Polarized growth protein n=1 Tax=Truncatella angustata TaxID=152316 RepID=A0A9P8UGE3_9PEZI|nr:putative polarized growth protein [Truncatella angustata]KAH6651665.1 putative polarized growth protein [Truncatella angustata]
MSPAAFLRNGLRVLIPFAVILTTYLYLYPVFLGCAFPLPDSQPASAAFQSTLRQHIGNGQPNLAPFRLLALGDPQIEGDTSLPSYYREPFKHLNNFARQVTFKTSHSSFRERVRQSLHDLVDVYLEDVPDAIETIRKRIDLFGNDFYLAHIYRTLKWWTKPSHVTVLGDLVGSQWIGDEEFERRSWRYWNRAFHGGERVPDEVAVPPADEYEVTGYLGSEPTNGTIWRKRIINIAGNHDVGYAGDLTVERLERFERVFGKAAYELRFELPITNETVSATIMGANGNPDSTRLAPEIRIVVINNMNLDTPAITPELQDHTYSFVNDVINTAAAVEYQGHFTVVLTHIPLYKPEGVCVDAPYFDFHSSDDGGGVKEQYQLSADASKGFLEGIFGLSGDANAPGNGNGRRGVILNGHDHEGCDIYHFINQTEETSEDHKWETVRWSDAQNRDIPGQPGHPGLRELTVRSMMGGFGGNAGLLSAWFDEETWEWKFEFVNCALGKQYLWWFVHIIDLITIGAILVCAIWNVLLAAGVVEDRWPAFIASGVEKSAVSPKAENNVAVPGGNSVVKSG